MKRSLTIGITVLALCAAFLYPGCTCDDDDDDNDTGDDDDNDDNDDDDTLDDDDDDDDLTDDDDDLFDPNSPSDDYGVFAATYGDDGNPGTMAAPLRTVQAAVDLAAKTGKVAFVAMGEYVENVNATASLYGGYRNYTWDRDPALYPTRLASPGAIALSIENQNAEASLIVEGLQIEGGKTGEDSCGLRVRRSRAIVRRCTMRSASVSGEYIAQTIGVAVDQYSVVELRDNLIVAGAIECAGYCLASRAQSIAVYSEKSDLTMVGNRAISRPASQQAYAATGIGLSVYRGRIHLSYNEFYATADPTSSLSGVTAVTVEDCPNALLVGNRLHAFASLGSQALRVSNKLIRAASSVTAINNLLHASGTIDTGGVAAVFGAMDLRLIDNIFELPAMSDATAGLYIAAELATPSVTVRNNNFDTKTSALIFIGATAVADVDELDACTWTGCADAGDNLATAAGLTGLYDAHLTDGSPCIDAGIDPTPWYDGPEIFYDFEGDARPAGDGWDIGMDEYVATRQP
ncbi:MAG TPA: hypothetical protein PK961_10625 [bacterium]|nr:hypothetical protein [bacterium]